MDDRYVYVLVRKDLPQPHIAIQAGHAILAATLAYGNWKVKHPNLVLCGVDSEEELDNEFNRLKEAGVPAVAWYEDDMEGQLTAVASGLVSGDSRKVFRKYRLLT